MGWRVFLIWPKSETKNTIEGAIVNIVGKVSKGGQPCGSPERPEQCLAPFYATQIEVESMEVIKQIEEVTIITDKTEYEQGETVKVIVENNLGEEICYPIYSGSDCWKLPFEVEKFSFDENRWENVPVGKYIAGEPIMCPQYMPMPSSQCSKEPINFLWDQNQHNKGAVFPGKYRIAFPHFSYEKRKVIKTKEKTIGKIICEENIPNELEELLLNGKWIMGDVFNKGCDMCLACGCSCTMKNAWAVGEASIDVTYTSCAGNSYTIKYKGEEYGCVSENYKPLYEQASLYPKTPEGWETIYSNEFTIKEKSALDLRCSEKVRGIGSCEKENLGYEFNIDIGKCIDKYVTGCSFETPFKTLEECQRVCDKNGTEAVLTPDYVSSHSNELIDKTIRVRGVANAGLPSICTEMECHPGECCNDCSGPLLLVEEGSKRVDKNHSEIVLLGANCFGNDCILDKCSPLEKGKIYIVTGIWNGKSLSILSFENIS